MGRRIVACPHATGRRTGICSLPSLVQMTHDAAMKRTVDQLIDDQDDAWPVVLGWVASAVRPVEILPAEAAKGEATLFALQVTTRSPMGAIALRAAGIH